MTIYVYKFYDMQFAKYDTMSHFHHVNAIRRRYAVSVAGCKINIDVHVFCSIHLREILQEVFVNLNHYIFSDISLLKSLPQLQGFKWVNDTI